jgi:L-asparaginase
MTKKILIISTGGTIVSERGENGLAPTGDARGILDVLKGRFPEHDISLEGLMSLDSSNIHPEHWREIARAVYRALHKYDGVIITHGTDTMAYTASALAFMLRNLQRSVVLTGAQIPYSDPLSDALPNLCAAVSALLNDITGVTVAFNGRIINGARAVKTNSTGMDAFESVNAPVMASVTASGMMVNVRATAEPSPSPPPATLDDDLCGDVFLFKLTPGARAEILNALPGLGYRGVVVEAFGAGGAPISGITRGLGLLRDAGVPVVARSQCARGGVDLSVYEVGRAMKSMGVISARDMTAEASVAKLMWALGKTGDISEIEGIFNTNFAGEVTL